MKLATEAYVRKALREATGARVEDAAVAAAVAELERYLGTIVNRVRDLYARECELRRIHGIHPHGRVRDDHVLGTTILPRPREPAPHASPEFV